MSERGIQLLATADGQISELIDLLSSRGEAALSLPCRGREKLGDGTVAAIALHTADNYHRIAGFLQASDHMPPARAGTGRGRHRAPGFLRARGHRSCQGNASHGDDHEAENVNLQGLTERLSAGLGALGLLTDLTGQRLDTVPPAGDMKFCDGQRTLEQVVTNLLKHQGHQIDALKAAVAQGTTADRLNL